MTASSLQESQFKQAVGGTMASIGGWLFRHRTLIPLPLGIALLLTPKGSTNSIATVATGVGLIVFGEGVRLWGVQHIGVISRTRSDRLGPLVTSGPFALVRNPLYTGNVALWMGFAVAAGLVRLAPIFAAVLAFEYHAIVRWEERLLDRRLGTRYRAYAARAPRWLPRTRRRVSGEQRESAPAPVTSHLSPFFSW